VTARSGVHGSRGYGLVLALGLVASLAVAVGSTRPWVRAFATVEGLPRIVADISGTEVVAPSAALGLAGLAGFGAVVATRGWIRTAVGALIVAGMGVLFVLTVLPISTTDVVEDALATLGWAGGDYTTESLWWRWLVAAAALVAAGCGVAVLRYGRSWATMGERYDSPTGSGQTAAPAGSRDATTAAPTNEADVWRAIDRGDDPTDDRTDNISDAPKDDR